MAASDEESPKAEARNPKPIEPIAIAIAVTLAVTLLSYLVPDDYAATAVGATFLFAVIALVLRHDSSTIRHYGLSLGGVLEPSPIQVGGALREAAAACAWAVGLTAVIAPFFVVGFRFYRQTWGSFH